MNRFAQQAGDGSVETPQFLQRKLRLEEVAFDAAAQVRRDRLL
jgi:hypothetical protein